MKTIIFIVCLIACFNLYVHAQQWNVKDTTDITNLNGSGEGENERIALFANNYGIHVLKVLYTGNNKHVKYYRLKTSGDLDEGFDSTGTDLDDYGDFPNIVGDENSLYAVYRKNDTIKIQFSSNGGSDWSSVESRTFSNGDVNCNGVDAAFETVKELHVVWSEKVGNKYESYFERFDGDNWASFKNITDEAAADSGGFPTVTTSLVSGTNRAHVTINTGNGDGVGNNQGRSYSRNYDYSNWSDPVAIIPSATSRMDRLLVTGDDYIHSFYYEQGGFPPFKYRRKLVTSSTWGSESTVDTDVAYTLNTHKIPITKTSDDTLHAFFFEAGTGFKHTKKFSTSSSWSSPFDVSDGGVSWKDAAVVSVSNDIFVMYAQGIGTDFANNYKYRQYDAAPLAPQNFEVSFPHNQNPVLTWNANTEPDLSGYRVYRKYNGGAYLFDDFTENTSYTDNAFTANVKTGEDVAEYWVVAEDINDNVSAETQHYSGNGYISGWKRNFPKEDGGIPYVYNLSQNYPNPFNPSTQISYSLAQDADVKLRIYDILGTQVAELVSERQTAGSYITNFDAKSAAGGLSSGVYIYRIVASNNERILFTDSKQMMLLR